MIKLSFPTKKLKKYVKRVNLKLRDTNYNPSDLKVYGVTNTEGITITGNKTSEDLSNYIVLKENQFAYNPYRVNVGSIGLAPKGLIGLVSPAYIVFETTKELDAEFLYYYLKSSLGINLIKWYGDRGGVRSALRYKDLCEIDIPDLNLNQQMSVLKKMKKANTEIEKLNSEICCQEKLISQLRQSILQDAVQGKLVPQDPDDEPASVLLERIKEEKERLIKEKKIKKQKSLLPITEDEIPYELPKGWEWVRLGEICSLITDGTHSTPNYVSKGVPFLSVKDISNGFIDFNHTRFITQQEHEELIKRCKPEYGDVLLTKVGTTGIAKVIDTKREFSIFVSLALLKIIHNTLYPYYIEYMLNSPLGKKQSEENTQGIGNKNLVIKCIKNFIVPLPPLNEQKRIVEKVDQLMTLCDELEKNIEQSKKDSELLMQSVLQEAFKEA